MRATAMVCFGLLGFACEAVPPEDFAYPTSLPDRNPTDASADSRGATLKGIEMTGGGDGEPSLEKEPEVVATSSGDAAIDARVDAKPPIVVVDASADAAPIIDAGACTPEVEPNDVVPKPIGPGKTCGALDGNEIDRFVFLPAKPTTVSVSASGFAVFYVREVQGGAQHQLSPGQSVTVGPSTGEWYVFASAPGPVSWMIDLE